MSSEKPVSINVQDREESIEYYDRMMDMLSKADRMGQDWNRPALGLIHHLLGLALPQLVGSLYRAAAWTTKGYRGDQMRRAIDEGARRITSPRKKLIEVALPLEYRAGEAIFDGM